MEKRATASAFEIAGTTIAPGERRQIELPVARLFTQTRVSMPMTVVHGRRPGPRLWVSAAIHGDELNGVEAIRQVLERVDASKLHGTLLAVPIVNVFGFIHQSRYLPDRRDLNRSFPGSPRGSLAAQLAHLFMKEVVSRCGYGIDLHTASLHRTNHPQVRADLDDPETRRCALAFGAPLMIHSRTRDGSLREAASESNIPVLLYEAGEALRFDEDAIRIAVGGVLRVMHTLGMDGHARTARPSRSIEIRESRWVRAPRSGILRLSAELGKRVGRRQAIGVIADAFGEGGSRITAPCDGIVLGITKNAVVHRGDAVAHVGIVHDQQ